MFKYIFLLIKWPLIFLVRLIKYLVIAGIYAFEIYSTPGRFIVAFALVTYYNLFVETKEEKLQPMRVRREVVKDYAFTFYNPLAFFIISSAIYYLTFKLLF